MPETFARAMEEAGEIAAGLMRHLEGLGDASNASPAAVGQVGELAERLERVVYQAVSRYDGSEASAHAYQALDRVEALRTAMAGNDVALMRSAASGLRDHLASAADAVRRESDATDR